MSVDTLIVRIRNEADDAPHIVRLENLRRSVNGDQVGGGNKIFYLNNQNAYNGSTPPDPYAVFVDGSVISNANYTRDDANGIVTLAVGQAAPTSKMQVTYSFQYLTDAEINDLIDNALGFLGVFSSVSQIPDPSGQFNAVFHKAVALCAAKIATKTAKLFDAQAGGKSMRKASISSQYLKIASYHDKLAVQERDDFYMRQGRRSVPQFGFFASRQRIFTPKR